MEPLYSQFQVETHPSKFDLDTQGKTGSKFFFGVLIFSHEQL
jgi:hypothetical protein